MLAAAGTDAVTGGSFRTLVRRKRNCPPRSSPRFIAYGRVSSDELPSTFDESVFLQEYRWTDTGNRMFHLSRVTSLRPARDRGLSGSYAIKISHDSQRGNREDFVEIAKIHDTCYLIYLREQSEFSASKSWFRD